MLLYVAGKYTGADFDAVDENIYEAEQIAGQLWAKGHAVICPHTNTAHFEVDFPDVPYEAYMNGDFNIIARCDGLVMVPNWKDSKGATREHEYAKSLDIPVWYYPDMPEQHPTELNSPIQCIGFREIVGKMYRTHLDKNADYSPANIMATGEIGIVTRLWDKTARLMNLVGIKFQHLLHEGVFPPLNPKNESLNDTYLDLAVYSIIGLLYRQGRWGR